MFLSAATCNVCFRKITLSCSNCSPWHSWSGLVVALRFAYPILWCSEAARVLVMPSNSVPSLAVMIPKAAAIALLVAIQVPAVHSAFVYYWSFSSLSCLVSAPRSCYFFSSSKYFFSDLMELSPISNAAFECLDSNSISLFRSVFANGGTIFNSEGCNTLSLPWLCLFLDSVSPDLVLEAHTFSTTVFASAVVWSDSPVSSAVGSTFIGLK